MPIRKNNWLKSLALIAILLFLPEPLRANPLDACWRAARAIHSALRGIKAPPSKADILYDRLVELKAMVKGSPKEIDALRSLRTEVRDLFRDVMGVDLNHPIFDFLEAGRAGYEGEDYRDLQISRALFLNQTSRTKVILEEGNGAIMFHGSGSGSLLAFTDFNTIEKGALIPAGELMEKGLAPFTGALDAVVGKGINRDCVSVVPLPELEDAIDYATTGSRREPWDPEAADREIEKLREDLSKAAKGSLGYQDSLGKIEVLSRRQKLWGGLNSVDKKLVLDDFPVIYGLRVDERSRMRPVKSVIHEIGIRGPIHPSEIKVIFVPKNRMAQVNTILRNAGITDINVAPIEKLTK